MEFTEQFLPFLVNECVHKRVSFSFTLCARRVHRMHSVLSTCCVPSSVSLAFCIHRKHREGYVFSGKNFYSRVFLWDTKLTLFFSR